eukprot:TRINITY_DN3221_c0_g1_i1.p1 TRINITY_DN3221_c0_g1~~TRINITY_DN3221_c0_g1_i1.p1  ORF type:complete len:273 (-),score=90.71 TRINITY_DN3221_c0_g1_i1:44-862(-)
MKFAVLFVFLFLSLALIANGHPHPHEENDRDDEKSSDDNNDNNDTDVDATATTSPSPSTSLQFLADGKVVELNRENFNEKTQNGIWFIKFYAPWCIHCKNLAPTWEKFALSQKGKVFVGAVNCDEEKELAQRFSIRGFPTLKLIRSGQVFEYSGARTEEAFQQFVTEDYMKAHSAPLSFISSHPHSRFTTFCLFLQRHRFLLGGMLFINVLLFLFILFVRRSKRCATAQVVDEEKKAMIEKENEANQTKIQIPTNNQNFPYPNYVNTQNSIN